ncbi:MAG: hypothetical protein ACFCGT_00410 [Sandaracinaceae bacterium]
MLRLLPILVAALVLGACLPIPGLPPAPFLPPPRPRTTLGPSVPPLARLGRYVDGRFERVSARSLPPSHLYVLVHGWAPGWFHRPGVDRTAPSWASEDATGRPFEPWVGELAAAITRVDPHAVVVAYSWLEDAVTGRFFLAQRRAYAATNLHGDILADALEDATGLEFAARHGQVHLIGHSFGARVAAFAALRIRPRQLTLFDPPDTAVTYMTGTPARLAPVLRGLPLGPNPGEVFVDNYVSAVGGTYHHRAGLAGVVDVALAPPYGIADYTRRHVYAPEFYAHTANRDYGFGWSRLLARVPPPEPACYAQLYGELRLVRGCPGG